MSIRKYPKISVVMITKNAEKYLAKSLDSVKDISEEIIIVDSGSKDKTKKIAKKYGAKVIDKKWQGFAKQKNYAISCAKNNWVLSLDADEILDDELKKEILDIDYNKYDGFYIPRKNFFAGKQVKHCGWYPDYQLRLFKKNKMRFAELDVHEKVAPKGNIKKLRNSMIHYTYDSDEQYFRKIAKYTDLDAKILYNKKRKWSVLYQFGKPIKEFWHCYITQSGYLDGFLGIKICCLNSYYRWLVIKKLRKMYARGN